MMKESLQRTVEVLYIFKKVQDVFNLDMNEYVTNFAKKIEIHIGNEYSVEITKTCKIISIEIILTRGLKDLIFRFSEMKNLDGIGNDVEYYIEVFLKNDAIKSSYSHFLYQYYYLAITDRDYINKLFPRPYITTKNEVDENKIYGYVREYLKVLKVMLAEPDFQQLLYDPDFWVYENPYK